MSPAQEGRQSPKPEDQSDAQVQPIAKGTGVDDAQNKEETNKDQLENLTSNPEGPLDAKAKQNTAS